MFSLSIKIQFVLVVLFGSLIGISYGFGIYLFPSIAPRMIEEFGFTYTQMGITTGLAQSAFMLFALASGFLTTWFGPFVVILGSLFICTASLGGLVIADNFLTVSLCLIVLGGCAASIWVPMVEVSQQLVHQKYQGRALGFMSSGTSYGVVTNSALITLFLSGSDWRNIWLATFIIACIFCACTGLFFRHLRKYTSTIGSTRQTAMPNLRMSEKLRSILSKDTFIIFLLMFLAGLACLPYQSYISSFLVDEHAFSIHQSATAWKFIGLTGMVSGFIMGWIGDRITIRRTLTIVCSALALSALIVLNKQVNSTQIYGAAVMFGFAFYAIYGLIPAYISHMYKSGGAALVFSLGSVSLGIGGVIGNVVGGWLKEVTGTFEWVYLIILGAAIGTIVLTFFMRNEHTAIAGISKAA